MPTLSRQFQPLEAFGWALWNAISFVVNIGNVRGRAVIALAPGELVHAHRLFWVFGDLEAFAMHIPQDILAG